MARTYKKDYCELDCLNCGERERVCTYNGECENLEPMTNEEWLNWLDTERKAKILVVIQLANMDGVKRGKVNTDELIQETVQWLKAEHKE